MLYPSRVVIHFVSLLIIRLLGMSLGQLTIRASYFHQADWEQLACGGCPQQAARSIRLQSQVLGQDIRLSQLKEIGWHTQVATYMARFGRWS